MADKTLPPIAVGDSLAVGMREANNLPGMGRVGAGPREVLDMLKRFSAENSLSGRDVFIGTGMPNIPEQKKFIEQQIDFVKKQGGNPILMGVGPGTKAKPTTGQNEFLAGLAERKGLTYMGPLANQFPDVTKDPMGLHLRPKQYQQLFKQFSTPSQAKPQPQTQPQPQSSAPRSSDLLSRFTGAVMEAESKGQRYDKSGKLLTSKAGALGEMQVMPKTVTDPGFGVKPARDMSPGEIARVGRDYAAVMLKRFNNDPTAAAVAYNWGPGNADKWVKRGADFNQLPKETQNYVARITGQMGVPIAAKRAPTQKRAEVPPVPPSKRVSTPSVPRAEAEIDYAPGSTLETASRPAEQEPNAISRLDVERLGPNYQAALATMALVDSQDEDEWDDDETIAERYMERRGEQLAREESTLEEEPARPSPLASLELSYQSPFPQEQQPVMMAHGGIVHRAEGSPIYGEGFDTGPITADTRAALSNRQSFNPREALAALKRISGEGVSNLESMARRSVATVPGVVGDIESIFRDDKSRKFATSEEVDRQYLPKRMTTPTKESEGYAAIGEFIDPTIALKVAPTTAKAALKAVKESGPQVEAALMKAAPAAQPMYAVKPKGGVFFPPGFGSNVDNYLEEVADKVLRYNPNIRGKDAGKIRDLIMDKGRKYITTTYATGSDPIREAILEGRLTDIALGARGSEKLFSPKLIHSAREGSPEALKKFEELYDEATNVQGSIIFPTNVKDFNKTFKVSQTEKEKMLKEGVPKELQNTSFLEKSLEDLKAPYTSEANKTLAAFIEGQGTPVPAEVKSLLTAVRGKPFFGKSQEPIYDMFAYGPKMDILSPNIAGRGIASLDIKDIEKMSFPEMIVRGAKNTLFERSQDAVIRALDNNKNVPNKFFMEGVNPVPQLKNTGWVSLDSPFATRVEGAAMRHSVGGYGIPGEYGAGGSEALLSGKVKIYSLRPEVNKPVATVEARMGPEGPHIFDVRSKFNSVPTEEETKKIFELFDVIQPKTFGTKTYHSTREGKAIKGDKPVRDWGEMYLNYLRNKNKGVE